MIEQACFVAEDAQGHPAGAILATVVPGEGLRGLERGGGWAHLTWIFVAHFSAGHGVGTALLAAAARELLALGYEDLLTTFLAGNVPSMLWHWRQGFRLLGSP